MKREGEPGQRTADNPQSGCNKVNSSTEELTEPAIYILTMALTVCNLEFAVNYVG